MTILCTTKPGGRVTGKSMSTSMTSYRPKARVAGVWRRLGVPAACGLILSACSSDNTGNFGDLYNAFSQVFLGGVGGGVTLQQAAAIPYATIGVRIDGSPEGMLALAVTNPGDERLWTSASRVA